MRTIRPEVALGRALMRRLEWSKIELCMNRDLDPLQRQRVPILDLDEQPSVGNLAIELDVLVAQRASFSDRGLQEELSSASDFARYRFRTLDSVRRSTKEGRMFSRGDSWGVGRKGPHRSLS